MAFRICDDAYIQTAAQHIQAQRTHIENKPIINLINDVNNLI